MINYYEILKIGESATSDEIKKAYRTLSKKYHPDVSREPNAENKFKEIAEAYAVLSDTNRKAAFDAKLKYGNTNRAVNLNFDSWLNNFRENFKDKNFRNNFKGQTFNGDFSFGFRNATYVENLHIKMEINVPLINLLQGKEIEVSIKKTMISPSYKENKVEKVIRLNINLTKQFIPIKKDINNRLFLELKLEHLGNERVNTFRNGFTGNLERIIKTGDLLLKIIIDTDKDITIEENIETGSRVNIVQTVDVSLAKVLLSNEKIRIKTIFDKEYDAEIISPKNLSKLKFKIKEIGLVDTTNKRGSYIIRINVIAPDVSKLKKSELNLLKDILAKNLEE